MADGFHGDVALLKQTEKELAQVHIAMNGRFQQLRGEIDATRAGWSSTASGIFVEMMNSFDKHAQALSQNLNQIGELLGRSGTKYEATEEDQQQALKAVANHSEISNILG
ncbi:WXG100 family type VII secretion target [Amycolatopsis minnesotensis]|uniref:ESAT-6-like protein n=1 Tax=Amycolatopsis minnesotensis TaxID=337894 RepID=A0ABN2QAZ5_9PSEU